MCKPSVLFSAAFAASIFVLPASAEDAYFMPTIRLPPAKQTVTQKRTLVACLQRASAERDLSITQGTSRDVAYQRWSAAINRCRIAYTVNLPPN